MKLFAHQRHVYDDRATHRLYEWAQNQYRDVPDEIGQMLLKAHPAKFCDVTNENEPGRHTCGKAKAYTISTLEPEQTTELVPSGSGRVSKQEPERTTDLVPAGSGRVSKQRLEKRRHTLKRSRVARANVLARG